jgi:hypothetical protein
VRYPTYLLLDEFQNFVGPDLELALPEVRQLGIRLLLSHQGFAQLKQGDYDLKPAIFQCQSRMIFGVQGEDADELAHELASIKYDKMKIKDELWSHRQRIGEQRIIKLHSWSDSEANARQWKRDYGQDWSTNESKSRAGHGDEIVTKGSSSGRSDRRGEGGGVTRTHSSGESETVVTDHEDFIELSSRTYSTFEEDANEWARDIRNLPTGHAFLRLVDSPNLHEVDIKRSAPGHLSWDVEQLMVDLPEALDDVDRLVEQNFQSDVFVNPSVIDAETRDRLELIGKYELPAGAVSEATKKTVDRLTEDNPFS